MKTHKTVQFLFATAMLFFVANVSAAPNKGQALPGKQVASQEKRLSSQCTASKATTDLNLNNVRARIFSSGDMWWDLVGLAKYEIPKVTEANKPKVCSIFAGSLWIGGYENNNLKEAAMTYRQNGVDFYSGPLDTITATTDNNTCESWDNMYQVTSQEIANFRADPAAITNDITSWPGNGNGSVSSENLSKHLAPYVDKDNNGIYDPQGGDYPDVPGDQAIWYVYNDVGGPHNETHGGTIGLECQELAFAFVTDDELNDMTFYKTVVINRSANRLDSTFFGQWVDPDLGYAFDDFVGCDTSRNLGYDYNGEDVDPGVLGYGANPPAVGVAFFHGPIDPRTNKEIGLKKFLYYNNTADNINGNPGFPNASPLDYYHYLNGCWKNGQTMKFGKDGVSGTVPTSFMFSGDPTYSNGSGGWTERSAGDVPGDRRFLESSGPFPLYPGAKNTVTTAVVWARTGTGGAVGSLNQLKLATDLARITYNNNFNILYGADAPDVIIRELDKEVVISLQNTNTTNIEQYKKTWVDKNNHTVNYKFEGYLVYQLANGSVSRADYGDPTKAKLIAQCDVKDSITGPVANYQSVSGYVGEVNVVEVAAQANNGLSHTFMVNSDAFATTSDQSLINYQSYYFSVVSYSTVTPFLFSNYETNYVPSAHNVLTYVAVPHKPDAEFGGTQINTNYGSGPEITRIEGTGNGGNILNFTDQTLNEILNPPYKVANPTYKPGYGPVKIKAYDPTLIQDGSYQIKFIDTTIKPYAVQGTILSENQKTIATNHPQLVPSGKWQITNLSTGGTIKSDYNITVNDEQILFFTDQDNNQQYIGMSTNINQVYGPGGADVSLLNDLSNGFLAATISYSDSNVHWLSGVPNIPDYFPKGEPTPQNWIRTGQATEPGYNAVTDPAAYINNNPHDSFIVVDPFGQYSALLGGIIAPAAVVARDGAGTGNTLTMGDLPAAVDFSSTRIANLNSVDLVFTPDQSKWSQCIVIEMGESPALNQGGAAKFSLRKHASWNKGIDAQGNPVYDTSSTGKSWFPGYAVNLESGERLNVFFSEDSHFAAYNGGDMLWNPSNRMYDSAAGPTDYASFYIWGAKHWIYVMNSTYIKNVGQYPLPAQGYDGCQSYYNTLNSSPSTATLKQMWGACIWVMEPVLGAGASLASLRDGLIPNETKISLRVAKQYAIDTLSASRINNGLPLYSFSTDVIAAQRSTTIGKTALSEVGIAPNPYYANSTYEIGQLDNRVRFINVPTKCEISIYTLDGTLIRKFTQDYTSNNAYKTGGLYPATYLDWDLTNQNGVPIASGVYLIHINAYDLGEKVLKWFGVMRPIDLDTF